MNEKSPGPGKGRPQKFPGEGARVSHSLRLTPAMAEKLRSAARAAHRTLGEEMEVRINRSFDGLALSPSESIMDSLNFYSEKNNRTVEEEAIIRISNSDIVEQLRSVVLAEDFAQKQASIITNFMRLQRIGIIIGRLLGREADRDFPPFDNNAPVSDTEDRHENWAKFLSRIESDFETVFGAGSINRIVEKYDQNVLDLVREASKGNYVVLAGRLQEVTVDPETGNAVAVFTGEDVSEIAHLPRHKAPSDK